MDDAPQSKAEQRKRILQLRRELPEDARAEKSMAICKHIAALAEYQQAGTVLYYMPIRGEVDILPLLLSGMCDGKRCLLPKCAADCQLELYQISDLSSDLGNGVFGIPEPAGNAISCTASEISAIIVPGVVYDGLGRRIGYGKGYYDRLLRSMPPDVPLIAPAYELQLVDAIAAAPHDIPVDIIATENRSVECRKARG